MLLTHEAMEELDLIKEVIIQGAHVFGVPSVLKKVFNVLRSPCFSSSFRFNETFRDFLVSAEFNAKILCQKLFSLINHEFLINAHVYVFMASKLPFRLCCSIWCYVYRLFPTVAVMWTDTCPVDVPAQSWEESAVSCVLVKTAPISLVILLFVVDFDFSHLPSFGCKIFVSNLSYCRF